mmetsp:Transcript_41252/g.119274  ORF Transcript_41252/g.119274 Transcript_41252/m.119274 type:complete len:83 (-) Transcript_41252:55-303(-)
MSDSTNSVELPRGWYAGEILLSCLWGASPAKASAHPAKAGPLQLDCPPLAGTRFLKNVELLFLNSKATDVVVVMKERMMTKV